ncbi:TetR/AcrR family transcriptional regulator [Murinocardiopsis flavida]|nr:TetR family transcriptional regulator [Murinocardiopsis flavida]
MQPESDEAHISDGRRRKGHERRRRLLAAVMSVIERDGVAAVTQRVVAKEAGLPPSAVTYYYATVDDLLTAALIQVNDWYIDAFASLSADDDRAMEQLAELIAAGGDRNRAHTMAEYELFLMAGRRPDMRAEIARWNQVIDAFTARFTADPLDGTAIAAAIDGLFLRTFTTDGLSTAPEVLAVLKRITRRHPFAPE